MNCKITRLLSLFVVMFTMFSTSAFALSSTYYSKVVATAAVGEGKVYASKSSTNSPSYKEGSSEATNSSSSTSAPSHTYYVYAQPKDGSVFVGWFDNAQCSGEPVSKTTAYTVKITANSKESNDPTTIILYAKFQKVGVPSLVYSDGHVYVNLSVGTYKNETLTTENVTETITYESSNTNVATVATDGTVTLKKNGSCYIKAKSGEGEGSYILTVIDDVTAGKTQIGNGDFEDWRGVTSSNHAPANWNGFETAVGDVAESNLGSFVKVQQVVMVEDHRPGSNGLYCVDIYSRSAFNIPAQGNLTTGCINAGAASAASQENYNFSKISDTNKSETISLIPSAIKLWVKFVPAADNKQHPNARVSASIHDAHNYITYSTGDNATNQSYAIAQAELNFPSTNGEWRELTIPFVPTGNSTDGQMYILVNLATNADPGEGQVVDHLYVDDIELVYDKNIGITVNGTQAPLIEAPIEVTFNKNNTIDFNLKNFGADGNYVGNISVTGLQIGNDGTFSYKGDIDITEGDLPNVQWIGPALGPIPLDMKGTIKGSYFYVHIDISMAGQVVEVEVGDRANATLKVSNALIGTFCAPFKVAIPADVTASTITGAANNGVLTLEAIEDGVIPANTPVVVQASQELSEQTISGIYVKGTPTAGLLTGVYEDTDAPVGSYVLQNNNGKVGFYKVAAGNKYPKVRANHAYLTKSGSNNVKAFYFNEDDATGIENVNINVNANEGTIYNVAGQRLNKMQKGINIINGKKILK